MMGIVVPETCWAYKKCNKIISGILLVFILQLLPMGIHVGFEENLAFFSVVSPDWS